MAIYYSTATAGGNPPKTGPSDVIEFFDFTWPANAAATDSVVLVWIPGGCRIIDWMFGVGATNIAGTTATSVLGDLNTAGTLAGANNYLSTLTLGAKTNVQATSYNTQVGTLTATITAPGTMGLNYSSTITANQTTGLALLTGVPAGVVDALILNVSAVTGGAKGVILGWLRYTMQNP